MKKTRERWLQEAAERLRTEIFQPNGHHVPAVRTAFGFTGKGGKSRKSIGICFQPECTDDKKIEIFVSPKIGDSPARIIDVLAHEMIHAMGHWDHRATFRKVATSIGLTGKMTATVASPELAKWCEKTAKDLGPWPGAKITRGGKGKGRKKQPTRLKKAWCPECGYTVRVTRKWLEIAPPNCPNRDCDNYDFEMEYDDA